MLKLVSPSMVIVSVKWTNAFDVDDVDLDKAILSSQQLQSDSVTSVS